MKTLAQFVVSGTLIGATLTLSGCFPIAATGIVAGAMMATDRRTVGAQTEDATIEFKSGSRLREGMKYPGGISVTSYNRKVLLTGQVATAEDRRQAEQIVARIDNVKSVENALQISGQPSFTSSAADATTSAAVKAALIETADLKGSAIKVVTESGAVYLMGVVSQREAQRASQVVSRVRGVQKVVTVFEIVSDEELARIVRSQQSDASK